MAIHLLKSPHAPVPAPRSTPPPAAPTPAEAQPLLDRAYWIAHSEGYRVDVGNRRLGFVQETFAEPDREGQMLLVIRGGVLGRRLYAARSEDVVMIVPREQRIWLRAEAALSEIRDATTAQPQR